MRRVAARAHSVTSASNLTSVGLGVKVLGGVGDFNAKGFARVFSAEGRGRKGDISAEQWHSIHYNVGAIWAQAIFGQILGNGRRLWKGDGLGLRRAMFRLRRR